MSPILSLRHYNHDQIIHSHHHTQLVFGLRGRLEFEIEGQGSREVTGGSGPEMSAME